MRIVCFLTNGLLDAAVFAENGETDNDKRCDKSDKAKWDPELTKPIAANDTKYNESDGD
jgi:hypothetical protein